MSLCSLGNMRWVLCLQFAWSNHVVWGLSWVFVGSGFWFAIFYFGFLVWVCVVYGGPVWGSQCAAVSRAPMQVCSSWLSLRFGMVCRNVYRCPRAYWAPLPMA